MCLHFSFTLCHIVFGTHFSQVALLRKLVSVQRTSRKRRVCTPVLGVAYRRQNCTTSKQSIGKDVWSLDQKTTRRSTLTSICKKELKRRQSARNDKLHQTTMFPHTWQNAPDVRNAVEKNSPCCVTRKHTSSHCLSSLHLSTLFLALAQEKQKRLEHNWNRTVLPFMLVILLCTTRIHTR